MRILYFMKTNNVPYILKYLFTLIFFCKGFQCQDTMRTGMMKKSYPSPKKAALFSALLPGAGQAYNRSWWKIPVIYAGIGTLGYFSLYNHRQYQFVRYQLLAEYDNNPSTINTTGLPASQLSVIKQQYKNRRDLYMAGTVVVYLIQIMEAYVHAHLKTFDISDDLSFYCAPVSFTGNGIMFCIKFKINKL